MFFIIQISDFFLHQALANSFFDNQEGRNNNRR